jgi:hypothetical protein
VMRRAGMTTGVLPERPGRAGRTRTKPRKNATSSFQLQQDQEPWDGPRISSQATPVGSSAWGNRIGQPGIEAWVVEDLAQEEWIDEAV